MISLIKLLFMFILILSSFDTPELPSKARRYIYELLNRYPNIKKVGFQTRPEFVKQKIIDEVKSSLPGKEITAHIGVESSNDFISRYCVHKGFGWKEFNKKVKLLQKNRIHPGAFVLFKPPFLTEKEAMDDALKSIKDCFEIGVEHIYLMCNNVAKYSITELLYKMGEYRPLWLWSIVSLLAKVEKNKLKRISVSGFDISSEAIDFPHNCQRCTRTMRKTLEEYGMKKDLSVFQKLTCRCKKEWETELKKKHLPLEKRLTRDYRELVEYYNQNLKS